MIELFSSLAFRFYASMAALAVVTAFVAIKFDRWKRRRMLVKEFVRQLKLEAMWRDY